VVAVRDQVRTLLVGYPQPVVADAVLVADALASNAYDHGDPPRAVRLTLRNGGACPRIEVDDGSPSSLPVRRGWTGSNGLGMLVITRVPSSWGIDQHSESKTVWAECDLLP
jgi:hypothetical protein